jgi:hypothetical protein
VGTIERFEPFFAPSDDVEPPPCRVLVTPSGSMQQCRGERPPDRPQVTRRRQRSAWMQDGMEVDRCAQAARAGLARAPPKPSPPRDPDYLSFTHQGDTASGPLPAALPATGVTSTLKTQILSFASPRSTTTGSGTPSAPWTWLRARHRARPSRLPRRSTHRRRRPLHRRPHPRRPPAPGRAVRPGRRAPAAVLPSQL